jgi:hypothetical protein
MVVFCFLPSCRIINFFYGLEETIVWTSSILGAGSKLMNFLNSLSGVISGQHKGTRDREKAAAQLCLETSCIFSWFKFSGVCVRKVVILKPLHFVRTVHLKINQVTSRESVFLDLWHLAIEMLWLLVWNSMDHYRCIKCPQLDSRLRTVTINMVFRSYNFLCCTDYFMPRNYVFTILSAIN